jgi:GTP-binding protein LepA
VLNKIDLASADPERVSHEIGELLGDEPEGVLSISAKTGEGVQDVLEAIVNTIPPPRGDPSGPPRALIFDSVFDQYRGVVAFVRVVDGVFTRGEAIRAMQAGTRAEIDDIGFMSPDMVKAARLEAGEVGYIITGIKDVA